MWLFVPVTRVLIPCAAAQDIEALTNEVVRLDPESGHVVQVAWVRKDDDAIQPELIVSGHRFEEVDVVLTFRASFGSSLFTWTADPVHVEAETSVSVPVTIPKEVKWADEQDNFYTDLEMTVQSYDSGGRRVGTNGGPRIKLLWSDHGFDLLDLSQAKALAPYGYVREAPPGAAELIAEQAAEGNYNVEFGPGL